MAHCFLSSSISICPPRGTTVVPGLRGIRDSARSSHPLGRLDIYLRDHALANLSSSQVGTARAKPPKPSMKIGLSAASNTLPRRDRTRKIPETQVQRQRGTQIRDSAVSQTNRHCNNISIHL